MSATTKKLLKNTISSNIWIAYSLRSILMYLVSLSVLSCTVFSQDLGILLCMWFRLSFNFIKSKSNFSLLVYSSLTLLVIKISLPVINFTCCITLKHVTSLRGAHLRVIAPKQHCSFWRNVAAVASCWQHCLIWLAQDLTSHFKDERITTWPTGQSFNFISSEIAIAL